ncbi:MAG TPA: sulfotransferase [Dongiaceae bacterium]
MQAAAPSSGQAALVRAYCADAEKFLFQDRLDEAKTTVEKALRLAPHDAAALNILGVIALQRGELESALRAIGQAATLMPDAPDPRHFLGLAYEHMGRFEEAIASFQAALALQPDLAGTLGELATAFAILGRREEAADAQLRLIEIDPSNTAAYLALAELSPRLLSDGHLKFLREAIGDAGASKRERANAGFALAAIHESRGEFDQEFAWLAGANRLVCESLGDATHVPVSIMSQKRRPRYLSAQEAMAKIVEARGFAETTFSAELLQRYAGLGHPSSLPVFILGMPRSGSSLIEHILASHPAVHGAGEIAAFHETCIAGQWPFEGYYRRDALGIMAPSEPRPRHFRILGSDYVKAVRPLALKAQRIISKMPGLFMHIGMIHLCLPNAVIIHSVRDPVDTCLGCYKRSFYTGNETTYDLEFLGRHYQEYRRVMNYWHRVLPGRVIDVVYEDLVRDPEPQIRRLLAACGLPWDPRCLRPHENPRPVLTASLSQLRSPIHGGAIHRWRRYEQHLGPLLKALGPYAPGGSVAAP